MKDPKTDPSPSQAELDWEENQGKNHTSLGVFGFYILITVLFVAAVWGSWVLLRR